MDNNNGNGTRLVWYILRTAIGVIILAAGSWATYVTSSITKLNDGKAALERNIATINTKLDMLLEEIRRGRR